MYFYIQDNKDWNYENKVKFGIADDYKSRLKTDQHSYKSEFISLYSYEINEKYKLNYKEIDNIISKQRRDDFKIKILNKYPLIHFDNLFKIKDFLINHGVGTEFINKDGIELLEKILLNDFEKLGIIIRKIPKEEWNIIDDDDEESDEENLVEERINDENKIIFPIQDNIRDYQEIIINDALLNIKKDNRVYISLATGGGKSFISYTILNELLSSTIIILTPRINICEQNIKGKYLKLLSNTYDIYDKDKLEMINRDNNNLICCCINSYKKVVDIIKNKELRNIAIWFDEAHYGIDNWIINDNSDERMFLLKDNEFIKYRLYTTASPDKDFVYKNNRIFGEFINPIKVRYLIYKGWLCNLDTYIYKDEIFEDISKKDNKIFVNFLIKKFENKNYGLCFSNSCDNALGLFINHLELYEKDNSIPKPFLLLNSTKINEYIKDKKISNKNIELFNIEGYEKDEEFKRIGYIVKMYSMGYDNAKIDFLIFKDPKMSHKDIIQSIGRGLRPYGNKRTDIFIPVYINDKDSAKKFDKIKEVLKYLLLDVEIKMKELKIIDKNEKKGKKVLGKDGNEEIDEFTKDIDKIIYEIKNSKKWTEQEIIRQLKYNDIHNMNKYMIYINENKQLNLPENLFEDFPSFNFNETYKNNSSPYYSREECIENIKNLQNDLIFEEDIDKENNMDLINFLIKKDDKIPNECLWNFYGGDKEDFIIFV